MKGLILNQYYSVKKSLWNYTVLSIFITAILIFTQNEMMLNFATWLPILFIVTPALEVLKQESMSGWNKFVLTLPLKRNHVVKSHYSFYSLMIIIGLLMTVALFIVGEFILEQILTDQTVYSIMNGVSIALIIGSITYPLTYLLGTEKSDMVLMVAVMSTVGLFFIISWLFETILGMASLNTLQGMNMDFLFAGGLLISSLVLFIISYIITLLIYKRKEF